MNSSSYSPNREVVSAYIEPEWLIELQIMHELGDYSRINNAVECHSIPYRKHSSQFIGNDDYNPFK